MFPLKLFVSFLLPRNHTFVYYDLLTTASIDKINRPTDGHLGTHLGAEYPFMISARLAVGEV